MKPKERPGFILGGVAAALFALAAPVAQATVTDWGVHGPVEVGFANNAPGSFSDVFTFTLPTTDDLASTTVANNLFIQSNSVLHISDGLVQLFQGTYGDATPDTLKLSYSFDGTTGDTSHSLSGLSTSSPYYYEVSGMADGTQGGVYTITSTFTSPVPEPETYGMLMAGLGLMGVMARKRSNKS